jgi:DNA-directed RNA polymerase subunit RPC12/RpoP
VRVPELSVVTARPDVGVHARTPRVREGGFPERIAGAEVYPERVRRPELEDVIPLVVGSVVERSRRRRSGARPERGRLHADPAEVPARPEQERTVAAHRDPADADPVQVRSRHRGGNGLAQHHRAPASVGAVVPVAVVSTVEQQDLGGSEPEPCQSIEERLAQELGRASALAVKEDEKPLPVLLRHDEHLVQVAVDQPAVQREADEPCSAGRVVAGAVRAADRNRDEGGYGQRMSKAAEWLREERRKVLGDWVAFCLGCGAARRWFEEFEAELPAGCPQCGGEVLRRCRACGAPFSSIAVVDCEVCGEPVRPNELFGSKIRRG